ncbi:MAG: hypothetical protein CMB57_04055 [Euryarchaeota archaeon]|nr:hypothetical protein [Euryarchaeota archaeon]|tara:strand:+ start:8193 stop:9455 length:1263 start_codon:yes stop_codon:yes gene_type:complete
MPPRKKQKTTLRDFTLVLSTISNLYQEKGDVGRSKSFSNASTNLCAYADLTKKKLDAPLKSSKDFKDVKGVGKSTLEMLDEFIKTGKCARLEELEEVKQVKLVKKTPNSTKKTEEEKLKCGVGIFREEGFNNGDDEKGYYMFAYRKSDKTCLHEDISEYYLDVCEYEESEYPDDTPQDLLDTWSTSYAGLMMWNTCVPEEKFAFVREATEDDMKRKDWKGDGLKSQSLILPTPDVAEDEVTREELRDLVYNFRGNFPQTHVDALKQLWCEEWQFIKPAHSNILSAMKLFPYKEKGYDFDIAHYGFKLIHSRVVRKDWYSRDIFFIHHSDNFDNHSSQPHGRVDIDVLFDDGISSTFSYWRHDNVTEDIRENNDTYPFWLESKLKTVARRRKNAEEIREQLWEFLEEQTLYRYQMENYSES